MTENKNKNVNNNNNNNNNVRECLKAGTVDLIRKRHFLGNGQRRFHC
jgi:hypothetical protein